MDSIKPEELADFLNYEFWWDETNQGTDYWNKWYKFFKMEYARGIVARPLNMPRIKDKATMNMYIDRIVAGCKDIPNKLLTEFINDLRRAFN